MHTYIDIADHAKPGTDQLEDRTSHCSGDNDTDGDLHICGRMGEIQSYYIGCFLGYGTAYDNGF